MPSSRPIQRILLVRLSHLGDVVHALPVFHALREAHPEAEIGWAVQPEFAELVRGLSGLSRVVTFDRRGGFGAWPRLWRELREFGADWAIDAQGNLKSAAVTLFSGARRRSGLHPSEWTETPGSLVLNDRAPRTPGASPHHALDRSLHLARHLTGLSADWLPSDWFQLSDVEKTTGRERWGALFGEASGRPVILQVAAPGDVRSWPEEHQLELLRELDARGIPVLALSGPGEEELGARLASELGGHPRIRHWVGQRGLRELAAFFGAAAEAGGRLVSCDSGPLHLAVASGLGVIGLAGPQDSRRTGPWAPAGGASPHRVVSAKDEPECAPCLSRRCSCDEGPVCMSRISVSEVIRLSSGG